ncbi:MAG: glycosyltransferase [Rhodospirillaceae bacterium]|nr:glycosyltransferase [Rhodospirillaceae bacterium]
MSYLCSLVIPTKNGGELFKHVVAGLRRQTVWKNVEFIIVDSQSDDDTVETAKAAGATCLTVAAADFNHGATRDFAISQATTNRIVLLVQDATPHDDRLIETLITALEENNVAGVYARQIPYPDADVITKRNLNAHWTGRMERATAEIKNLDAYAALPPHQRYMLCNFDNVCSAIRKDVWAQEHFGRINFGEDIDWAERVLKRGHKIVYEPKAAVIHSHDRPLSYEYKRTYVCHRKLYNQFRLQVAPTLYTVLHAWVHWTLRDMAHIARHEPHWPTKLQMIFKSPAYNLLRVWGQYRAVRDEKAGAANTVRGV